LLNTVCALLAVNLAYAVTDPQRIPTGKKAKVYGSIVSLNGDLLTVKEKKSGAIVVVNLTDNTKVEGKKGAAEFFRHQDMNVTAMVPGLTVDAEGVGNVKGQLDASKITFTPNEFAIEVSQEQQTIANRAAVNRAQTTANTGVSNAAVAQSSANAAQLSANAAQSSASQAGQNAQLAGVAAAMNAEALGQLKQRVSDLGDYKTVALAGIYFESGQANLDDAAMRMFIGALDPRLKAVIPACFPNSYRLLFTGSDPHAEMTIPNELGEGLDTADFVELSVPTPWLIQATEEEYFYRWFIRWLQHGEGDFHEQPAKLYTNQELLVTRTGRVEDETGSRKLYQLILDDLHAKRKPGGTEALLVALRNLQIPTDGSAPAVQVLDESERGGIRLQHITYESEKGIEIEAQLFVPAVGGRKPAVLLVAGKLSDSPGNESRRWAAWC
jgi:hypothetical protein